MDHAVHAEGFGFFTQVVDVELDDVFVSEAVVLPDFFEKLGFGEGLTGGAEEAVEEGEFGVGEEEVATGAFGEVVVGVELDVFPGQGRSGEAGSAEIGFDAGEEFFEPERLHDVVVAAVLKGEDDVFCPVFGGEKDDWELVAGLSELFDHCDAVHEGHHDVGEDEVDLVGQVETLFSVLRNEAVETRLSEGLLKEAGHFEVVFDNKDAGVHRRKLGWPESTGASPGVQDWVVSSFLGVS